MSIRKCIKLKKMIKETKTIEETINETKRYIEPVDTDYILSPSSLNIGRVNSSINLDIIDIILSGGFTKGAL